MICFMRMRVGPRTERSPFLAPPWKVLAAGKAVLAVGKKLSKTIGRLNLNQRPR